MEVLHEFIIGGISGMQSLRSGEEAIGRVKGRVMVGIDLGAETLWLETLSASGYQDTREFLEWRLRHGLSLSKTADALGFSRRMVAYYSNGEKRVPRPILLACKGWEVSRAV